MEFVYLFNILFIYTFCCTKFIRVKIVCIISLHTLIKGGITCNFKPLQIKQMYSIRFVIISGTERRELYASYIPPLVFSCIFSPLYEEVINHANVNL